SLLDRVAETGETLIITKRGKAVARLVPARRTQAMSLRGSVTGRGAIVRPILDAWNAGRGSGSTLLLWSGGAVRRRSWDVAGAPPSRTRIASESLPSAASRSPPLPPKVASRSIVRLSSGSSRH